MCVCHASLSKPNHLPKHPIGKESKAAVIAREQNNFKRRICEVLQSLNFDSGFVRTSGPTEHLYTGLFWLMSWSTQGHMANTVDSHQIYLRKTLWSWRDACWSGLEVRYFQVSKWSWPLNYRSSLCSQWQTLFDSCCWEF